MKKIFLLVGIIFLGLLVSCDTRNKYQDLKDYIAKLKHTADLNKKPPARNFIYQPKPAHYQKELSRTPFEETHTSTNQPGAMTNPLNRYPITLLRFVGTVMQGDQIVAYITTPDNKIYQATIGIKIGDHDGTISRIGTHELEISEPVLDDEKPGTKRTVTLQLKDEKL